MGFPRQEFWSGFPFPSPRNLLNPEIKPTSLMSPGLAGGFFSTSTTSFIKILVQEFPCVEGQAGRVRSSQKNKDHTNKCNSWSGMILNDTTLQMNSVHHLSLQICFFAYFFNTKQFLPCTTKQNKQKQSNRTKCTSLLERLILKFSFLKNVHKMLNYHEY